MSFRSTGSGLFAGLTALVGGGMGCLFLIVVIMIGPWALQYDLNHWMPLIKPGYTPLGMSFFMFIGGLILCEIAVPVAVLTWVLFGLGLVG